MAELVIGKKTILELLGDNKADFLIPDYQRPYSWEDDECQTLWEDIFAFAIPENDYSKFDSEGDPYFLGPIVTFKNEKKKIEVIDGQQRLTTLMLLLRAFYEGFGKMADENSVATKKLIEKCIWKTDEFGNPNKEQLKIDSEVASDDDKKESLNILKTGDAQGKKSRYAKNYQFFQTCIDRFRNDFPTFFAYLPNRILKNCILLPIETESMNSALRIFSTLNDRGLPLSDSDIFKAKFYNFFKSKGGTDNFINRWKNLESLSAKIFHPNRGTPMDELFTRYMYFERALQKNKNSTTEALRSFYEKDDYKILKSEKTLSNLEDLVDFWKDVAAQNEERFSERVLRRLFILDHAPNGMWCYFTSVYFMQKRNEANLLGDDEFYDFLGKTIAFIFAYAVMRPGVNALRTPIFAEMVNIVEGKKIEFSSAKFERENLEKNFSNFEFLNGRPITKSILTWWAMKNQNQPLAKLDTVFEIEHIFAKKRQEEEKSLTEKKNLESLGNKSLLEKGINIRAADYKFADKKKFYTGFTNDKGQKKGDTIIQDLKDIATTYEDFTESDIESRKEKIISSFIDFVGENGLLS